MYFDNLTIAGIAAASLYALLPLLFGRETLRVKEDRDALANRYTREPDTSHGQLAGEDGCGGQTQPCRT